MTLPELPQPATKAETADALSRLFAAQTEYLSPDDPAGPDYVRRTAVNTQSLYGLTVETIGSPLPL